MQQRCAELAVAGVGRRRCSKKAGTEFTPRAVPLRARRGAGYRAERARIGTSAVPVESLGGTRLCAAFALDTPAAGVHGVCELRGRAPKRAKGTGRQAACPVNTGPAAGGGWAAMSTVCGSSESTAEGGGRPTSRPSGGRVIRIDRRPCPGHPAGRSGTPGRPHQPGGLGNTVAYAPF